MQDERDAVGPAFPPSAAALAERDRRGRRLYLIETPIGAAMLVVGVLGGLGGDTLLWFVGACGAAMAGIGTWALLRYRRIAADNRYFDSGGSSGDS